MSWFGWLAGRNDLRIKLDYTLSKLDGDNRFTITDNETRKKLRFTAKMADEATGVAYFELLTPQDGNDEYEMQLFEKDGDNYVDVVRPADVEPVPTSIILACIFELARPDGEVE